MAHSFDEQDAIQYGILEAVLLYNIRYWVAKNVANEKHFYDGKYWTYNSAKAYARLFPYASQQTIQRALRKLEEMGAIVTGCYNTNPYDHTKWYSVTDSSNLINQKIKSDQPSNTDINTDISLSGSIQTIPFNKIIEAYELRLPNSPVVRRSLFVNGSSAKETKQRYQWVMSSKHERGPRAGQRLAETEEQAIEWFDKFFGYVAQSDFLAKKFQCNLKWLMKRENFEKVLSGQYHKES